MENRSDQSETVCFSEISVPRRPQYETSLLEMFLDPDHQMVDPPDTTTLILDCAIS